MTHVVVGTTLACGEDGHVDTVLDVLRLGAGLVEEDQTSTGATESLVTINRKV